LQHFPWSDFSVIFVRPSDLQDRVHYSRAAPASAGGDHLLPGPTIALGPFLRLSAAS
jgi:hypothetical protein